MTFDVHWNDRDSAWYFSLLDSAGLTIISGVKIVLGTALARSSAHAFFSTNFLKAFDTSGQNREATFDDIGVRVILLHATVDELQGAP